MKRGVLLAVLVAGAVLATAAPSQAQFQRYDSYWARSTNGAALTLDGVLDEPQWAQAESIVVRYPLDAGMVKQPQATYTETGWEVFAQGLTDLLAWFKRTYGDLPVYITENGAAFFDPPVADDSGRVRDPLRTDYLRRHLLAVHEAIRAGVDVRGYMVWSLLDNMEWSLGYSRRFGIVHVDYATQQRTPKDSARYYQRVVASHGRALAEALPG